MSAKLRKKSWSFSGGATMQPKPITCGSVYTFADKDFFVWDRRGGMVELRSYDKLHHDSSRHKSLTMNVSALREMTPKEFNPIGTRLA